VPQWLLCLAAAAAVAAAAATVAAALVAPSADAAAAAAVAPVATAPATPEMTKAVVAGAPAPSAEAGFQTQFSIYSEIWNPEDLESPAARPALVAGWYFGPAATAGIGDSVLPPRQAVSGSSDSAEPVVLAALALPDHAGPAGLAWDTTKQNSAETVGKTVAVTATELFGLLAAVAD